MIRRARIETKINHERWLVSYSDFITLLFAFFVVMYSVSHVSESKYRTLSETLEKTFSPTSKQSPSKQSPSKQSPSKQSPPNEEVQPETTVPKIAELGAVASELEQVFSGTISTGQLTLSGNEDWVELAVNAELLFESGSARPSAEAVKIFAEVAGVLAPFDNAVAVSGHTDNVPINTEEFQNNWQLSSARAVSVVNLLAFAGVDPSRLSAIGYGEYRPVADNTTAQGRAANRRVVLRVARDVVPQTAVSPEEAVVAAGTGEQPQIRQETSISEAENSPNPETVIEPVKLKNGGLLFTSDPNLPQHRRRIEQEHNNAVQIKD